MATVGTAKDTTLYEKSGDTRIPLNPATSAAQVATTDSSGKASTVEAEIAALRTVETCLVTSLNDAPSNLKVGGLAILETD